MKQLPLFPLITSAIMISSCLNSTESSSDQNVVTSQNHDSTGNTNSGTGNRNDSNTISPTLRLGKPVFYPSEGVYQKAQSISMSTNIVGSEIRYTTDGSNPAKTSKLYASPISISKSTQIKAVAFKQGYTESPIASASYTIGANNTNQLVKAPQIFPASGQRFANTVTVTITTATPGATIYYTVSNSTLYPEPTKSSKKYTGPFSITLGNIYKGGENEVVHAIAFKDGYSESAISYASYYYAKK